MIARYFGTLCAASFALSATCAFARADDALKEPVQGPKRICFNYVAFDLMEGEQVVAFGGGVETAYLDVESAGSSFHVGESEIYQQPRHRGRLVREGDGVQIYRVRDGEVRYLIYGHADFLGEGDRYIANISGPALTGTRTDAEIYRRFGIVDDKRSGCEQSFVYGWDVLFDDREAKE
jgi:hypothetical protein